MNDEELIKETMMLDYSQLVMHNVYMIKENKRLNNIINELEKLLKEEKTRTRYANDVERFTAYDYMLKRLQELKGSDKE